MSASDHAEPEARMNTAASGPAENFSMTNFASDVWQKGVINAVEEHPREAAITALSAVGAAAAIYLTRGKPLVEALEGVANSDVTPGATSAADNLLGKELPISWGQPENGWRLNSIARESADEALESAGIKRPGLSSFSAASPSVTAKDTLLDMRGLSGIEPPKSEGYLAWIDDPRVPHPGPLKSYADDELARRGMTLPVHLPQRWLRPGTQEAFESQLKKWAEGDLTFKPTGITSNASGVYDTSPGSYTTSKPDLGRLGLAVKTDFFDWMRNLKSTGGK